LLIVSQRLTKCSKWFRSLGNQIALITFPIRRAFFDIAFYPIRKIFWSARRAFEEVGLLEKRLRRTYNQYLHSEYWKQFRQMAIEYHEYKCAVCSLDYQKKSLTIQVHHYQYKKWGRWILEREHLYWDVCLLCPDHHFEGQMSWLFLRLSRREYEHFAKHKKLTKLWKFIRLLNKYHLV
jgi:hypothetical protein